LNGKETPKRDQQLFRERLISFEVNAKRKKGAYLQSKRRDTFLLSQGVSD
jgi:hypothetical protein